MRLYSVIGLWIDGELVVAGVAEGIVPMVDNGPDINDFGYQRYAETFEADDPDHAERLAIAASREDDEVEVVPIDAVAGSLAGILPDTVDQWVEENR